MLSYLFVYGTLRRGQSLHAELERFSAKFVSEGWIMGRLYNLGSYPGAVLEGQEVVRGELYRVAGPRHGLRLLDRVEGPEFCRRAVRVSLPGGGTRRAWMYLLKYPVE